MRWNEAKRALEQGKKVCRDMWQEGSYIYGTDPVMHNKTNAQAFFKTKWFDAEDWKIVQENKPLSDKEFDIVSNQFVGAMFRFSDVKEHLKILNKFLKELNSPTHILYEEQVDNLFENIFGDDLL